MLGLCVGLLRICHAFTCASEWRANCLPSSLFFGISSVEKRLGVGVGGYEKRRCLFSVMSNEGICCLQEAEAGTGEGGVRHRL